MDITPNTFYTQVWDYQGYQLVSRPDTPNYYIAWCKPGSSQWNRLSTRTADLELAQQRLMEYAQLRRSPPKALLPHQVLIADVLVCYINEQLSGKACKDAESIIRNWNHFCQLESISTVSELTRGMQQLYMDWRIKEACLYHGRVLSSGTINKDMEVMRAALNHAKREGYISEVPAIRMLPKPPPRDRYLEAHEVRNLLAVCEEPHLRMFVLLAIHTLQRPGAIFDLQIGQVDLARRRIDFNPPGRVQTSKRRPVVPITKTLRPELERAINDSLSGHLVEYLGQPVKSVRRSFEGACKRAGLADVSPYVLRHTGATLLAANGVPIWQISGMLGHSISKTTEIYAKHSPDFLSQAADQLDVIFGDEALPITPPARPMNQERGRPRLRLVSAE
ncbi:hypothetical protein COB72_01140 [bacterium]|nr:MAG: hypothetical protein COB72_01140 [bacterium]